MNGSRIPNTEVGFISRRVDCWSRYSRKQRRLKDRGWLLGSSALLTISLPLGSSGGYVEVGGPETGRRHQHEQMLAITPRTGKNSRLASNTTPPFQLDSARRYLGSSLYNVQNIVQCTLGDAYRLSLNGGVFK